MTREAFDRMYGSQECVWGLEADRYLAMHVEEAPRGRAFDVGCGEGRHALFLAQEGYTVDAVDISAKAVEKLMNYAEEYGVSQKIRARVGDIRVMEYEGMYELVVISFVFPFLRRSEITSVLGKAKNTVRKGGCIYVSALTTDDVEYKRYSRNQTPVEPQTYYSEGLKCNCYFFGRGELKTLFEDFYVIDYTEVVVELPREPYTHSMCLIFAQK